MKNPITEGARGLVIFAAIAICAPAAAQTDTDRTLSPYFLVSAGEGATTEEFPLESTSAEVRISGVIAAVTVKQRYRNRGIDPIEAIYLFPASTRAVVNAMKMTIGERVIEATIQEKHKAKAIYQQAKDEGKRTSLLEQQRPNVFQMNVANILPGDTVEVELGYTELLVPEEGEYAFVYPTVVGPRYNGEVTAEAPAVNGWVANPYLEEGTPAPYRFDIDVAIDTGIPIQALTSPSHALAVDYENPGRAVIALSGEDRTAGDRDFILNYRLQGKAIESGLMLHRGDKENFFLLMAQPPERVTPAQIPPRDYIFIVDISGSMHGFPLDTSKKLMSELLPALRPSDRFNILFFAGGSTMLAEHSLPATKANIRRALTMMNGQRGGGGTRMLEVIQRAMSIPAADEISRSFVVITDGYVSIELDAFQHVRDNLNHANFFAFGIGSSVNRFLIEGLARAGRGEPFVVTDPRTAAATAERFQRYIQSPVLTGIELDFGDLEVYDVEPQTAPDLLAERPLIVFGKWRGEPGGTVTVRGYGGDGEFVRAMPVPTGSELTANPALRYLWARDRVASLGDFEKLAPNAERARQITTLGLTYNLLTAYTSFVAVDTEIANATGESETVKQPLPLPQGVSNHAVGGGVPIAPEPEINALLAVLACLGLWQFHRQRRNGLVRVQ